MDEREVETKKKRVISPNNLPTKLPLNETAILLVIFKVWPPDTTTDIVIWAFVGAITALGWINTLIKIGQEEYHDIFSKFDVLVKKIVYDSAVSKFHKEQDKSRSRYG